MSETNYVRWSEITPHLPPTWRPVGHPYPVPLGVLFVVAQPAPLGSTTYAVLSLVDGHLKGVSAKTLEGQRTRSTYSTSRQARAAVQFAAEWMRKAPKPEPVEEDIPDEPGFLDHTDRVTEQMIEDAEQERMV